jgi:carbamoyl-phosphate synthase large subunit
MGIKKYRDTKMGVKKVLVLGAGGSASTNYVRSLRLTPEKFHIIGVDCNKYYLQRAETNERYLVPMASDKEYIPKLNKIIQKTGAEFIHAQNDAEVFAISKNREQLKCKTFLPEHNTIRVCQNKYLSSYYWSKDGFKKPRTYLINTEEELLEACREIHGEMWIRDVRGAGGKGSLKTGEFEVAKGWIEYRQGWGTYTVAEYLSEKSTTFTSVWKDGLLIAGQGRKRLYWELGSAFISGISGATGGGMVDNDPVVAETAIKSIKTIDSKPKGIFSVDMTYGQDGLPYPTEINISRFFTTHFFFAKAGFNVAYIYTKLGFGEKVTIYPINPLKEGLVWIRGMDFEPILTTIEKINAYSPD